MANIKSVVQPEEKGESNVGMFGLPADSESVDVSQYFDVSLATYRSIDVMLMAPGSHFGGFQPGMFAQPGLHREVNPFEFVVAEPVTNVPPVKTAQASEPPVLPFGADVYLLESSHFYTDETPASLVDGIMAALAASSVVSDFNAVKYKFKCSHYSGHGTKLTFRIRLYTVNESGGKYLIEVQRRSGCCIQWKKLYDELLYSMTTPNIASEQRTSESELAVQRSGSAVDGMVNMEEALGFVRSNFKQVPLESQVEMSSALAALSATFTPREIPGDAFRVTALVLLDSRDETVKLNTMSFLANAGERCLKRHGRFELEILGAIVNEIKGSDCCHTSREALRAIMHLSTKYPSEILKCGAYDLLLKNAGGADEEARGYASVALRNLAVSV